MSRWLYSTDASSYQILPRCVVLPRDEEDVVYTIRTATQFGIPIIPRGGGTSLSGQGIGNGVILDFTRYFDSILEINAEEKWAEVQAGVILDQLNQAAAAQGLMVGPDPSSSMAATLAGMTANNSTGSHSIAYGLMVDHVQEVTVALSDGSVARFKPRSAAEIAGLLEEESLEASIYREVPALVHRYRDLIKTRYPKTWRNVAGYNLNRILADQESGKPFSLAPLIVGSEGTLGTILTIRVGLVEKPTHSHLTLLHFDSSREALSSVPEILEHQPSAVEMLDRFFMDLTRGNAEYNRRMNFIEGDPESVLIVEFSGSEQSALVDQSRKLIRSFRAKGFRGAVVEMANPAEIANVWDVRKAGLGLLLSKRGDAKPLAFIDDAAVPVEHLPEYVAQVREVCRELGTEASFYAHASAGCLHINPLINLKTAQGLNQFRRISEAVIDIAIRLGGTSTGEHGEGLARSYYNEKLYGPELHRAFGELKAIFDPHNLFNPGKIVDKPLPWDPKILRFNPDYRTPLAPRETYLDFSADGGFSGLVEMCNGQGNCRNLGAGTMCPSFRATRDEAHSTRGRANALRAAITGFLGPQGFNDPALYHILDLCLACKACKVECPSIVDMAKLKYEYLARYQEANGAPLSARLFANIALVNAVGSLFPWLSNALAKTPVARKWMERHLHIDARRSLPPLAEEFFQKWFRKRRKRGAAPNGPVVLWDDTFLSFNEPEIGKAAVRVLEAAGFEVLLAENRKCCGRPLISKGFLKKARKYAAHNVGILKPFVQKGIPVVGVEPGCTATFRDEYPDLLKGDDARLIARNTLFIEEFLVGLAKEEKLQFQWPQDIPPRNILLHAHCYQKALNLASTQLEMLRLIPNARVEEISDSGCCGMAGAFGYEREHYDISMQIGELKLFPAIRSKGEHWRIAAAGTSCRHQIADGVARRAEHPIVLFAKALFGEEN